MVREGRIFPLFKKGLDGSMIALLRKNNIEIKTKEQENPVLVDWKSKENLHNFAQIQGNDIEIDEVLEKMCSDSVGRLKFYNTVVN